MTTKTATCLFFLAATSAWGVSVGDTYQQVISEKGKPRSSIDAGSLRMLNYPDMTIRIKDNLVVSVKALVASPSPTPNRTATNGAQIDALARQVNDAVTRVVAIINQPVTHLGRAPGMKIDFFGPPWFHPGATRPDFNTVDITKTQDLMYSNYGYVSSEINPNEAFLGQELEFNSMTKYFYADLSIPKKKLTLPEMLEINRLYRIIGQCEQQLIQLGYTGKMP